MKNLSFLIFLFLLNLSNSSVSAQNNLHDFLRCLSPRVDNSIIITPNDSSFHSILYSSIHNPRFSSPETPKPILIITPVKTSDIQATIKCARRHGVHVRTRSGGHDYEGLSYVASTAFVIIDLMNLRSINLDIEDRTAWVQTGATIGELYYEIGRNSKSLGFPAGLCPTVGVGGHFSGGGYGTLSRKYGLAADNIIDANVIDANGNFLDRRRMGEEFFWALQGGGGSSFAVVLAWKLKLVDVPSTVTVFSVTKTSKQNAINIINRWQYIVDKVPNDLYISVMLERSNNKDVVTASFRGLYLGRVDDLVALMEKKLPELGLVEEDCVEMSWIESVVWFTEFPAGESIDVLAKRTGESLAFKAKSDFVQAPMPETAIRELWSRLYAPEAESAELTFAPFGGRMSEIEECETPFPHRAGNIYQIQYMVFWKTTQEETSTTNTTTIETAGARAKKYMKWVRKTYDFMTPYVLESPRGAYINVRDLDLGKNIDGSTKYEEARKWGVKYFKNNFDRLVRIKTMVDPDDFFRDEQSIPSLKLVEDS